MTSRLPFIAALLCLAACASPPRPAPPALQPLGLIELSFSAGGISSAHLLPLGPQDLTEQPRGLQLRPLSVAVFNTGTRNVDGVRYISATYRVRNADADGTASPTPRSNLTLIPVSAGDTLAGTPYRAVTTFAGGSVAPAVVRSVLPGHGLRFDPLRAQPVLNPGGEDFQVFTETEIAPGSLRSGSGGSLSYADLGVQTVFPYGYVVRNVAGGRTLSASPAADQFDGQVTLSVRVPLQADDAGQTPTEGTRRDPWAFRVVLLAVQDSATRVTQSPDEQTDNALVTQRAAAESATQVTVLPGSSYAGPVPARCVNQVRTAGLAGDPGATYLIKGVCP